MYLTLKDIKTPDWKGCEEKLKKLIADEFKRHNYLLSDDLLTVQDRIDYESILTRESSINGLTDSLKTLTQHLFNHYKQKVIVLIDEYDTPIHEAYERGYYTHIVDFLRGFWERVSRTIPVLKDL